MSEATTSCFVDLKLRGRTPPIECNNWLTIDRFHHVEWTIIRKGRVQKMDGAPSCILDRSSRTQQDSHVTCYCFNSSREEKTFIYGSIHGATIILKLTNHLNESNLFFSCLVFSIQRKMRHILHTSTSQSHVHLLIPD